MSTASGESEGKSASEGGGYSSNVGSQNTNDSNATTSSDATDTGSSSIGSKGENTASHSDSNNGISFSGIDFSQPNGGISLTPSFSGLDFSGFYGNDSDSGNDFSLGHDWAPGGGLKGFDWNSFSSGTPSGGFNKGSTPDSVTYEIGKGFTESNNNSFTPATPSIDGQNFNGVGDFSGGKGETEEGTNTTSIDSVPWTFTDDTSESKKGRNEISVEDYYFNSLAGDYGKTEQDFASGNLRSAYTESEGEKAGQKAYDKAKGRGKSEEEAKAAMDEASKKASEKAGNKYDRNYNGEMLANAYRNFNEKDMANENYASLVDAARQGFGDRAQEAIQIAGKGKGAYASLVNEQARDDKNAYGSSEKKAKQNRDSNKSSEVADLAAQSSRGKGLLGEISDNVSAGLNNAGYHIGNFGDNVYTAFGGVNRYGNTWSDTHGENLSRQEGDERTGDKGYFTRVGHNVVQGAKNVGNRVDTFFGGADNETGLARSGLNADRNGDGKVDVGERITNMVQRALMGKNASQYDVNGDGKVDFNEGVVGTMNHLTDFTLLGDKMADAGRNRMQKNGGHWYNNVLGAMQMAGGYLTNAAQGTLMTMVNPLNGLRMGLHGISEFALEDGRKYGGFENVPSSPSTNSLSMSSTTGGSGSTNLSSPTNTFVMPTPTVGQYNFLKASPKDWDDEKIASKKRNATTLHKERVAISDARLKDYVYRTVMTPDIMDTMTKLMILNYKPQDDFGALWKTQQLMR